MTPIEFRAMGTAWWVAADREELLTTVRAEVDRIEACCSRFLPESALSRLNRDRRVDDRTLAAVVEVALAARAATAGAFDPTLGAELVNWGYDRTFQALRKGFGGPARRRSSLEVSVAGSGVELAGEGQLDLGGIAKGWAVDHLASWLREGGCEWALVDGGGDLYGFGAPWRVGTPSGHALWVNADAVATSSTRRRRWTCADGTEAHHILDPGTAAPVRGSVHTVTVQAATAHEADVWAKAILIRPALVASVPGTVADVLIGDASGAWWTRRDLEEK